MKSNKRGWQNYNLEDVEKCLQVQSHDEERLLKFKNIVTQFESLKINKEKIKKWYDISMRKHLEIGNNMLFFKPKLGSFLEKLKNRWLKPFTILQIFPHGVIELINNQGEKFKVNG